MNSIIFVLFGKYCLIVDQLGSKDSSHDFQLKCISYFLSIFITSYMSPKISVMKRERKNYNFWEKKGPGREDGGALLVHLGQLDGRERAVSFYLHAGPQVQFSIKRWNYT
jgi:hypothetical protein